MPAVPATDGPSDLVRAHGTAPLRFVGSRTRDVGEDGVARELHRVLDAIDELPPNCRRAFVLHRRHGLSHPEIAQELGVSTSMVEKHVFHALRHCRRRLRDT